MKVILFSIFLIISSFSYSQSKYDTLVRKRYIDSLKYQLSIYSVASFDHLNMYDRAENEKSELKKKLDIANKNVKFLMDSRLKLKLITGLSIFFAIITLVTMDSR